MIRYRSLRYLRIDTYCIIQDSEKDKECEISRIDLIYKRSYLTTKASGSSSVKTGFLGLRKESRVSPLPLQLHSGHQGTFFFRYGQHNVTLGDGIEPIATRA